MRNPFIHRSIEVRRASHSRFGVFAKELIQRGTLVESCSILPITKKIAISIEKTRLNDKLFVNPDGAAKERSILQSIQEMELERRLDQGLITLEDFRQILVDNGHLTQVLDIETAGFLLGYGSYYNTSLMPNVKISYNDEDKLYDIIAVKDIQSGLELTYLK